MLPKVSPRGRWLGSRTQGSLQWPFIVALAATVRAILEEHADLDSGP